MNPVPCKTLVGYWKLDFMHSNFVRRPACSFWGLGLRHAAPVLRSVCRCQAWPRSAPCQGFGFGHLACACTVLQVFQSPWLHLCGLLFAARFLGSPLGNPFSFQGVAIRHYFSGVRLRQCMHSPAVRFATSAVCQGQGFGFRHSALFVL